MKVTSKLLRLQSLISAIASPAGLGITVAHKLGLDTLIFSMVLALRPQPVLVPIPVYAAAARRLSK